MCKIVSLVVYMPLFLFGFGSTHLLFPITAHVQCVLLCHLLQKATLQQKHSFMLLCIQKTLISHFWVCDSFAVQHGLHIIVFCSYLWPPPAIRWHSGGQHAPSSPWRGASPCRTVLQKVQKNHHHFWCSLTAFHTNVMVNVVREVQHQPKYKHINDHNVMFIRFIKSSEIISQKILDCIFKNGACTILLRYNC